MKARLLKLAERIDALHPRERIMMFAAAAGVIVFVIHGIMLAPALRKQQSLSAEIRQQQNNLSGMDAEIVALVMAHQIDPDQSSRARLSSIVDQSAALTASLRAMQTALVAPERVAPMLETIMKANSRLKLVSLGNLPVEQMNGSAAAAAGAATLVRPKVPLIYRHGVQVAVRGNYLDMIDYMDTLQAMPSQVFWGRAHMEVQTYPNATLTLTLHTLSMDEKWMKL